MGCSMTGTSLNAEPSAVRKHHHLHLQCNRVRSDMLDSCVFLSSNKSFKIVCKEISPSSGWKTLASKLQAVHKLFQVYKGHVDISAIWCFLNCPPTRFLLNSGFGSERETIRWQFVFVAGSQGMHCTLELVRTVWFDMKKWTTGLTSGSIQMPIGKLRTHIHWMFVGLSFLTRLAIS